MAESRDDQPTHHLAQVNIARMRAPIDDPVMAGFVARLDEINALADQADGFVWRLKPDEENESQVVAFENDGLLFNLSVWQSVEALRHFVYKTMHKEVLQAREQWFEKMEAPHMALWWIPVGHIPAIDEALLRLDRLELLGPSQNAFTFASAYPAPVPRSFAEDDQE